MESLKKNSFDASMEFFFQEVEDNFETTNNHYKIIKPEKSEKTKTTEK